MVILFFVFVLPCVGPPEQGRPKTAVIPKPHINLIIYHGVLAPNAKLRKRVVKYGRESGSEPENEETEEQEETKPRHYKWAE